MADKNNGSNGSVLVLEVKELLVSAQLKAGNYNKESYYGHAVVNPQEAMIIQVPVSELGTKATIQEAIASLHDAVVAGVQSQIGSQAKVTVETREGEQATVGGPLMSGLEEKEDDF